LNFLAFGLSKLEQIIFGGSLVIKQRSFVMVMVFSLITFGIYALYWLYATANEVNTMCEGDGKQTTGFILFLVFSIITFGIYTYVWYYKLANRLQENASRYNITVKENGVTILLWMIPGSFILVGPFIAYYLLIKNINAMGEAYNAQH
jgi:hypothetical protein